MPTHAASIGPSPHKSMDQPRLMEGDPNQQPIYRVTDMDLSPTFSNGWQLQQHINGSPAAAILPRAMRGPHQYRPTTNGATTTHPIAELPLEDDDTHQCESPTANSPLSPPTISSANTLRDTDVFSPPLEPLRRDSLSVLLSSSASSRSGVSLNRKASSSSLQPVSRTPSLKAGVFSSCSLIGPASAASSCFPSPIIAAMGDVTPLPSPMMPGASPGPWRRLIPAQQQQQQQQQHNHHQPTIQETAESLVTALASVSKRAELPPGNSAAQERAEGKRHGRNRSVSEYVPDPLGIPKRHVTVSGSRKVQQVDGTHGTLEPHIKREANLAKSRGIVPTAAVVSDPPSPPRSVSSRSSSEQPPLARTAGRHECFEADGKRDGKRRRWRSIRRLGEGTFSRVELATSDMTAAIDDDDSSQSEWTMRKSLVAVKVCEHGPCGGASEERVEMSLKRELEIMQIVRHPSLVDLKAWRIEPTRAILVLSYCPGGDLFDVATAQRSVLVPALVRRMVAELVGAVRYLHGENIVHRDVKLENVLVNLPPSELAKTTTDWAKYPYSVITLTDLGLSRKVADGEKLETRCGSDDYAAPEVIMGQPYDGRATDAWSLGVLLYALLETRLPFDPPPNMPDSHRLRSRASHRIARVDWNWIEFGGDQDADHEGSDAKFAERGLVGAREIVEGLLKRARSRWPLEKVAATEWVKGGIAVEGGIKFREEDDGEVVQ